jgi:hypothetical protein
MLEILVYCPTREMFVQGMTTTQLLDGRTLATLKDDRLIPVEGVQMDEIGPIMKTPPVFNEAGEVVTPAVMVEGHHVNFRVYGDLAKMLTDGLPQTNPDGTRISLFERTHILDLIPGLAWQTITEAGVPAGYEGPNQVRLFDPQVVNSRARVWA